MLMNFCPMVSTLDRTWASTFACTEAMQVLRLLCAVHLWEETTSLHLGVDIFHYVIRRLQEV